MDKYLEQRQKIRDLGQNAQIKSLEIQLRTEREANKHLEKIERTVKDLQRVVDSWNKKYENTPEKKRTRFHVIKQTNDS